MGRRSVGPSVGRSVGPLVGAVKDQN